MAKADLQRVNSKLVTTSASRNLENFQKLRATISASIEKESA
jgi:hypothetical protein